METDCPKMRYYKMELKELAISNNKYYYMVSGKMLYVAFCQIGFPRMNLKSSSVEHDVAKNKEEK